MNKILSNLGIEKNVLNEFKGIHKNATTIVILTGETLNAFCLRGKQYKDTWIGIIIISLNTMPEIFVSAFRQGIEVKDYKDKN